MKPGKYDRNVTLYCPTCGSTQFETNEGTRASDTHLRCLSCNRELTEDELIQGNADNIQAHVDEIGQDVLSDVAEDMRKSLKSAFRGSKNFRIR